MPGDREAVEVEALLTDHYLDGLLSARDEGPVPATAFGEGMAGLDRGVRVASLRLQRDLPRFRPTFQFEERLAIRLAQAAAALQVARAAGTSPSATWPSATSPSATGAEAKASGAGLDDLVPGEARRDPGRVTVWQSLDGRPMVRPVLISGAVASAALSILAATVVARRRRQRRGAAPGSALVARLVHPGRMVGEHAD